jgi:hypothetical protein
MLKNWLKGSMGSGKQGKDIWFRKRKKTTKFLPMIISHSSTFSLFYGGKPFMSTSIACLHSALPKHIIR